MSDRLDEEALTHAFQQQRPQLLRVAYATTGSLAEAEDCVQEAWLRLRRMNDPMEVRNLDAWLTTTVSRLALDALGSARSRRESYVGPWLPEPLVEDIDARSPADRVTLDESVSMALLVVLERLSPAERTAFLLHDVFGLTFEEIAGVVGRSPAAVRQLASRARKNVERGRPRFPPTQAEQKALVGAFLQACQNGDVERLTTLLDPNVICRGDGGGKVTAALHGVQGADRVARALIAYTRKPPRSTEMALINGSPGLVLCDAEGVWSIVSFTVDAGRFIAIDVVRNPDKLTALHKSS